MMFTPPHPPLDPHHSTQNVWYTLKEWFLVNNTTMTAPTAAATTTPTHHHTTPTNGGGGGGRHGSGGHAPPQQQQQRYKVHLLLRWHAESVLNACWKHAAAQAALPVALQVCCVVFCMCCVASRNMHPATMHIQTTPTPPTLSSHRTTLTTT